MIMNILKVPYVPALDQMALKEVAEQMETKALRQSINIINWPEFPYKPIVAFSIARGDKELYLHYYARGVPSPCPRPITTARNTSVKFIYSSVL